MASVASSQRHKRSNPCPVCGGFDELPRGHAKRCAGFTNGDWIRCTRPEQAGSLEPEEVNGTTCYRHFRGDCKCGVSHGTPTQPYRPKPGELAQRDEIEATYDYLDEHGEHLFQVVRLVGKGFRQRRKDPNQPSGWAWRTGDVRRVLYRLPELLAASTQTTIYIVEGEKDVESLRRKGYVATCNPGGAGKWHLVEACASEVLRGRKVAVLTDLDGPDKSPAFAGQKHALVVATHVRKFAASCIGPLECTRGHDITDHLLAGGTVEELVPMRWSPDADKPKDKPRLGVIQGGKSEKAGEPPAWDDDESPSVDARPDVRLYAIDIASNTENLDRAIAGTEANVYQRDGQLVHVIETRRAGGGGYLVVSPLEEATLRGVVSRYVRCVRWTKTEEGESWVPCLPQVDVVLRPFLKHKVWKHIKPLTAATESPVVRPDGTVMQAPGYDEATGYLYRPAIDFPPIPDAPTQDDARKALADLQHVFCDFPYDSPAAALVPIAALLTIVGRAAIQGPTPAFVFNASVRGSGKTLQADVVHSIAFGRSASHATWPERPYDQEQLLSSFALDASPVAFFDNVKGRDLGGPALEAALTSRIVEFRVLGGNSKPKLDWVSVIMVSGNNITMTDDMLRRCLVARLVPTEENPESRTEFAHEHLVEWVTEHRARLLVCALTILRAYACKGWPSAGTGVMQSFNAWSRVVPGAISYAGGGNVLDARPTREAAGGDEVDAVGLLAGWLRALTPEGSKGITCQGLVNAVYPPPRQNDPPDGWELVREAIEALVPVKGPKPDAHKLGMVLGRYRDRWIGGIALRASKRDGRTVWYADTRLG